MSDAERARIEALIERIVPYRDGLYRLVGPLTSLELQALHSTIARDHDPKLGIRPAVDLNLALFSAEQPNDSLMCIDFGTAASKIAWNPSTGPFEPLAIGVVAGDDEPDPFWVRSAIAIDDQGMMVFGRRAELAAERTGEAALTSFKSRLWEEPHRLNEIALESDLASFTYEDCIQAYLAYLTLLGEQAVLAAGGERYTPRRYAMPYAYDLDRKLIRVLLGDMLGKGAVLADTLGPELKNGVEAWKMRLALDALVELEIPSWIHAQPSCVGEPVAAGNFAMDIELGRQTVYMIVDIGAGTTDFCILCLKKRGDTDELEPIQIRGGSVSVPTAGDAIDQALVNYLVRVEQADQWRNLLARNIRATKERLFNDGSVDLELPGQALIHVKRDDFVGSPEWQKFVRGLARIQAQCFDQADRVYVENYGSGAVRVVITGGGSVLPVRDALASGRSGGEINVLRVFADALPEDILNRFAAIQASLPRLAVSLGGALDQLPADHDRTDAKTTPGISARRTWKPIDKSKAGLHDEYDEQPLTK